MRADPTAGQAVCCSVDAMSAADEPSTKIEPGGRRSDRRGRLAAWAGGVFLALLAALAVGFLAAPEFTYEKFREPPSQNGSTIRSGTAADVSNLVSSPGSVAAWNGVLREFQREYQSMGLVIFSDKAEKPCPGIGASGLFYCPARKIGYFDISRIDQLRTAAGEHADTAMAYAVGHVMAHHAQGLMGVLSRAYAKGAGRNDRTVEEISLQAECLAGIWARRAAGDVGEITSVALEASMRALRQVMTGEAATASATPSVTIQEPVLFAVSNFDGPALVRRMDAFFRGYDRTTASVCNR